jgi:hypothetical protein
VAEQSVADELGLQPGAGGSTDVVLARLEAGMARLAERLDNRHETLATAVEAVRREGATANELLKTVLMARMDTDRVDLDRMRSDLDQLKGRVEADKQAAAAREEREREIVAQQRVERSNVRLGGVYVPLVVALIGVMAVVVVALIRH